MLEKATQKMLAKMKPTFTIHHWITPENASVFFVSAKEIPMLEIKLLFWAGSSRDSGKDGLAQLTNSMIGQATQHKSNKEILDKFDEIGAEFYTELDRDVATIGFKTLTDPEYLTAALNLFSEIITQPIFPEEIFKLTKSRIVNYIHYENQFPEAIVKNVFFNILYENHPYAHPIIGTENSVTKLMLNDINDFYNQFYVASNCMLLMIGNLQGINEAKRVSSYLLEKLPLGSRAEPIPTIKPINLGKVSKTILDTKQSHIMMGKIGVKSNDANYFPLLVGNYILGGGALNSRLFDEIRSKRGLVYNISSTLMQLSGTGPFVIILQTSNEKTNEALDAINQLLTNFLKIGPTQEEVISAKNKMINAFPLTMAGNSAVLKHMAAIAVQSLPLDYLDSYYENINAITLDHIMTAWDAFIPDINSLIKIIVGNYKS